MPVICGYKLGFWMHSQFLSQYATPLPNTPSYAHDVTTEERNPFETLHDGISKLGDILLLGDFNARTKNTQVGLLNFEEDPILVPKLLTLQKLGL